MSQTSQPALADLSRALERFRGPLTHVAVGLSAAADACLHPLLVLPLALATAALPHTAIGVVAGVALAGWALAQIVADPSGWRGLPARWPSWLGGIRALLALALGTALAVIGGAAGLSGMLLLLIAGFWIAGGLLAAEEASPALRDDDAASAAQVHDFWRGVALVLVGLLLARWLGPDGLPFPGWAVMMAVLAAVGLAVAAVLTWQPGGRRVSEGALWPHLPLLPALLGHGRRLRRYTLFRGLLAVSSLADPFYLLLALRALDLPWQSAGVYIALFALVRLVTSLVAPPLMAAGYARLLAQVAALTRVLIPLLVLSLPLIMRSSPVNRPEAGAFGPLAFAGVVVLFGLATASIDAADTAYLRDALAPVHRPATRGLLLGLVVVLSLAYMAGGAVSDRWGFEVLMLVAFGGGLLTLFASGILLGVPPAETRDMTTTGALPTFRDAAEW